MQKTLSFDDDAIGKRRFAYLYASMILGGSKGQTQAKDELRREAGIQIKLETISDVVPEDKVDLRYRPATTRDLKPGGGAVVLTVAEIEVVEKLMGLVTWGAIQKIPVADLYDFLSSAPTTE